MDELQTEINSNMLKKFNKNIKISGDHMSIFGKTVSVLITVNRSQ